MRISEICSLKWNDINFDEHYLQVKWVLKTENSYRKITLDSETINKLKEFKEFQNSFQENHQEYFHKENDLVFTSGTGKKLEPNNFREYYWYRMIKKASLPENFRIHCMRHTHATLGKWCKHKSNLQKTWPFNSRVYFKNLRPCNRKHGRISSVKMGRNNERIIFKKG